MPSLQSIDDSAITAKTDGIFLQLNKQPTEIVGLILSWLAVKDLLNLRITNHSLHNLVHDHAESTCSKVCSRLQSVSPAIRLATNIHSSKRDLLFCIKLSRRYHLISEVSTLLSERLVRSIKLYPPFADSKEASVWHTRKERLLQRRLLPALFVLNNFLESLRLTFALGEHHFADLSDEEYMQLKDVYSLDQQHLIEQLEHCDQRMMCDITHAFFVLNLICTSSATGTVLPLDHVAFPRTPFKRILVMRGLLPFASFLKPTTESNNTEGRVVAKFTVNDELWRGEYFKSIRLAKPPLVSVHHLHTDNGVPPDLHNLANNSRLRSRGALANFTEEQDIWLGPAAVVAQRKYTDPQASSENKTGAGAWLELDNNSTNQYFADILREDGDPSFQLQIG